MSLPRRLQRLVNFTAQRPARSVFVGALFLLYLITLWNNEVAWRKEVAELATKEKDSSHPFGNLGVTDDAHNTPGNLQWQAQAGEKQDKSTSGSLAQHSSSADEAYITSARMILNPDAFRDHFDNVMKLPPLSFEEGKAGCNWPENSGINFQFSTGEGGMNTNTRWTLEPRPQKELDEQRDIWHNFMNNDLLAWKDYSHKFEGRGIVIVGGKSVKRVSVLLKALVNLGSQMPVELHYWKDEVDEDKKRQFRDIHPRMYFNDLSAPENPLATVYDTSFGDRVHYNLKTAALINTRFAEPLLMDSDNIPINAPDSLWESDVYKEFGTIFWPDIARTRPDNPIWSITNTKCRMDEYEQESGQLLVDKGKFFYHLQLAAFMNAPSIKADGYHESYYFDFLLGDKDTFRFAWHALKTKYGKPSKFLTGVGTVSGKDNFYCGHSFLQYHPDGSPLFMHGGLLKTMQKPVMKWQREEHGGIFQYYKKSDYEEQHDKIIKVFLGWDGMDYFPNKEKYNFEIAWCTFFPDIEPRPLEELAPGFEKAFEAAGGYWPLDSEGGNRKPQADENTGALIG